MKKYIILALILIIAFFLRFYKLGEIPNGLQQDETSIGYNAYSIVKTGKDEYGKAHPLIFKAFGEYKLPGYIYIATLPIALFGTTAFSVRLPSAVLGALTILLVYALVAELFIDKNKDTIALFSALFVALNPWHIHFSRGAFEVTPALFFLTLGVWSFLLATRKQIVWPYLISALGFILSMYTYNITRVLSPIIALYLILFYRRTIHLSIQTAGILGLFVVSLLIPFLYTVFTSGGFSAARGTLLFTSPTIQAQVLEFRSYMTHLPVWIAKLLFNSSVSILWLYLMNIINYLSVSFLFIGGSLHGNHGIGTNGQFYVYELIFIVIGIKYLIRKKTISRGILFWWAMATVMIAAGTREAPQATRSFFLIVPLEIFSAIGVVQIIKSWKSRAGLIFLIGCMSYAILRFGFSYTQRFPVAYASAWRSADQELSSYIKKIEHNYEKIIFDSDTGFIYTSYLFYTGFSPEKFYQTAQRTPDNNEGFNNVTSFGKFEIKNISEADFRMPNTLIVTTAQNKPEFAPLLRTFYYPSRPVVFALNGEIISYPVEDIAYVAVLSKPQ